MVKTRYGGLRQRSAGGLGGKEGGGGGKDPPRNNGSGGPAGHYGEDEAKLVTDLDSSSEEESKSRKPRRKPRKKTAPVADIVRLQEQVRHLQVGQGRLRDGQDQLQQGQGEIREELDGQGHEVRRLGRFEHWARGVLARHDRALLLLFRIVCIVGAVLLLHIFGYF